MSEHRASIAASTSDLNPLACKVVIINGQKWTLADPHLRRTRRHAPARRACDSSQLCLRSRPIDGASRYRPTMPLSNRTYGHNSVTNPFLFGLLPDSEDQRKAIAAEHRRQASNNPVALLMPYRTRLSRAAVQFCRAEADIDAAHGRALGEYRPLYTTHEIALQASKSIQG